MSFNNVAGDMVCKTCYDMLYFRAGRRGQPSKLQTNFDHHKTIEFLKFCADENPPCYICKGIWEGILRVGRPSGRRRLIADLKAVPILNDTFRLDFRFVGETLFESSKLVASFVLIGNDGSAAILSAVKTYGRPASGRTDSPEVFALAKDWISECAENHDNKHPNCSQSDTDFYPTRLVEVDALDQSRVRVVSRKPSEYISNQPSFTGKYVTLSHKWGQAEFLKLKAETRSQFQTGIRVRDLPRTFQDAILFTRELGIRWIWIDALCVIQNSKDDWLAESATMRQVYTHSYCNISATAADDSQQGLFNDRPIDRAWAQTVSVRTEVVEHGKQILSCTVLDLSFWERYIEEAPINQRSWVLQERLLAPRVLHFCKDQIAFECRAMDRAECRPQGLPHLLMLNGRLVEGARLKRIEPSVGKELREIRLGREYSSSTREKLESMVAELDSVCAYYEVWKRIVELYTKMQLSKQKDRLIALSGIARMMKTTMESVNEDTNDYIAGLWQNDLGRQLLWYVNDADGFVPQPSVDLRPKNELGEALYRAPTFSWASVETPRGVTFGEIGQGDLKIKVEIVRLLFENKDDNFGILTDGYIVLQGILRRIWLVDQLADLTAQNGDLSDQNQRGTNRFTWQLMSQGKVAPKPYDTEYSVVYLDSPASEPSVFGPTAQVFVIPALLTDRSLICIMVQATDGDYGIRYRRVGLTTVDRVHEQAVQNIVQPPGHSSAENGKYYSWGDRDEKSGTSTICII